MTTSDIPYQTFNCPHCGAPGSVSYGQAQYTCTCRFRTFVTPEPVKAGDTCPTCGEKFVPIPGGIYHECTGIRPAHL